MDDDIWDDEGDSSIDTTSKEKSFQKDLEKLEEIHSNEGYKAGIVAGQSKSAQQGFDAGYRKGADYAMEFGRTLGEMMGIARMDLEPELRNEVDDLVTEGSQLAETAGEGTTREEFERFQTKCKTFLEKLEGHGTAPGSRISSDE